MRSSPISARWGPSLLTSVAEVPLTDQVPQIDAELQQPLAFAGAVSRVNPPAEHREILAVRGNHLIHSIPHFSDLYEVVVDD